jgi:hypothetical protein
MSGLKRLRAAHSTGVDPSKTRTPGRHPWRSRPVQAAAVLGVIVTLAGCSGATSTQAGASGTATPSGPTTSFAPSGPATSAAAPPASNAPDPNAPEVNAAGDIPDNQVFVPFTVPNGTFVVSVPQGWARSPDGAATVFTDKFNSVRVEAAPRPAAPDVATARSQEVPQLQASVPGFALGDVRTVQRSAGPAVLITYEANSALDAVTGKTVRESVERYTFWHNGQQAVLTLSGPKGADNVDPWRTVTDSLRWLR